MSAKVDLSVVVIDRIKPKDLDEIIELNLATKELQTEKGKAIFYSKKELLKLIKSVDEICLAARVDKELAGYRLATFHPILKEAYLYNVVIKEKFRHQGIGRLLYLKTFEELARKGCVYSWALVHEDNLYMRKFIEKQGFKKGRKFFYYDRTLGNRIKP